MPDAFDILGVPPAFDLAPAVLRAAYLARAGGVHPDMADDPDAEERSAQLNEARRALENPESRAEVLLARLGGPRKEQDRSLPPAFLQEMMEVREQIESELAADPGAPVKWDRWAQERRRESIERVRALFSRLAPGPGGNSQDHALLRDVRMELNMWRYVERLIEQLTDGSRAGEAGGGGGGGGGGVGDGVGGVKGA